MVRWGIDDVRTAQGGRTVKVFLDGLSKGAKAKVYAALEMLAQDAEITEPRRRAA